MDDGRLGDEMTLDGIAKQLEIIRSDLSSVKADLNEVKADLGEVKADLGEVKADLGEVKHDVKGLDAKADAFETRTMIKFDETKRTLNLGFENVQIVDEKFGRRFDDAERARANQDNLLEAALLSLRRDARKA